MFKEVPMTRELNRLNDVFFKYLLGDEKKKSLTLSFINGILNRTGNDLFTDLEFLDKELTPITEAGKVSVLDIRARMNDGSQVNIEVQVCKDPDMARRSLYYWARMYSGALHKGAPYRSLMPAISINLMDFNAFEQYTTCHHSYHVHNDETHDILIGDLEMHFIELEKIRIGDIRKLRKSEQWIAYFSHQCSDEQREVLAMSEPAIKEAMNCEMHFTQDEKLRRKYEIQEKARRDYISMMYNIEKGREEGLEENKSGIASSCPCSKKAFFMKPFPKLQAFRLKKSQPSPNRRRGQSKNNIPQQNRTATHSRCPVFFISYLS